MKTVRLALLLFHFCVAFPPLVAADAGTGIVRGQISNETTGAFLEGAIVQVEGTAIVTRSERGGSFSLALPGGEHALLVRYTGLNTRRIPVVVEAGQAVVKQIALTSDVYSLEPYTVTGLREGNALAIQLQRQADNVKTVVSTDAFGNPAVNPGELLQRLSGVSVELQSGEVRNIFIRGFSSDYASLMIDGNAIASSEGSVNHRMVNIQQIGTNNLESIELIKAPTPDMNANAIGGYINVRTKRAFDRAPGRVVTVSAGTRWTVFETKDIRGKDEPRFDSFSFSFSDVYSILGKKNNLGLYFTAGYRSSPLLLDEVGTYAGISILSHFLLPTATNGLTTPLQRQFGTGTLYFPETRNVNIGLNIDYKLNENTYFYLKNTVNDANNTSQNSGLTRFQLVSTAATSAGFAPGSSYESSEVLPAATSTARLTSQVLRKTLKSHALSTGFEHKMPASNSKLNVDLNYSLARSGYPIISQVTAYLPGVGWRLDRGAGTDEFHPVITQTGGPSIYDPANYKVGTPGTTNFRQTYQIPNEVMGARIDYRKDFALGIPAYVKVGGQMTQDLRKYKNTPEYFTYAGPTGIGDFVAPLHKSGDGLYGPFPHLQGLFSGLQGDPYADASLWTKSPYDAYYTTLYSIGGTLNTKLREKISAAYVMGSVQFKKLRIVPGVRVERTSTAAQGRKLNQSAAWGGNYAPTLSPEENVAHALRAVLPEEMNTSAYTKAFPGIHFIYEPFDKLLVRASYNTSITRPPVLVLVPSSNAINDDTQTITISNPSLKPYTSDNFEFAIQKYFEPVGSFEVGVYLKEIKDYYRSIQTFVPEGADNGFDGQYAGYRLNRYENVGAARYRGFEFNYQQQFSFLPGFWRGFGLSANFTYTQAEGVFGGTAYLKRLANVRPRFGNVAVSYIGHGVDIRLLANYQGKYYKGGAGATTLWGNSQTMLDLKTQYRINQRYQVYFEVSNLLDENVSTYVQEGNLPLYAQKQGMLFAAGVKATF